MKSIEEQIWDYIDDQLTEKERAEIAGKIAKNADYASVYAEMMELHQLMAATELDEPSMSFTRNVMEKVQLETTPVSLKTKVDTRIIYGLAAVFLLAIVSVFSYALANSSFTLSTFNLPTLNINMNLQQVVNPLSLQIFFFVDIMLVLLYLDRFFRSKKA
jgi:anti-sigma factor RsiW